MRILLAACVAAILACSVLAQDTKCTAHEDCASGFYCECSDGNPEPDLDLFCRPVQALGEYCGGFRRCADRCADGLVCQAQEPRDGPMIADLPGKCCAPIDTKCPERMAPVYDELGCLTSDCRPMVCGGATPLADENGAPLFCGRGPAHVDCPDKSFCQIAPDDRYAVCCPDSAAPTEQPTDDPVGSATEVDVSSEDVRSAADCAMAEVNQQSNSAFASVVTQIISGTQQVVAGMKYALTVEIAESSACKNDGTVKTLEACPADGAPRMVQLEVLVQPWMEASCSLLSFAEGDKPAPCPEVMCMMYCENGFQKHPETGCDMCICNDEPLASSTEPADTVPCPPTCRMYCEHGFVKDANGCALCKCNPPPSLPGGSTPISDLKSDMVLRGAQCAVNSINKQSNALFRQMLLSVVSGTQQVVAGMRYILRIQAGESSSCRNDGSAQTLAECPITGAVKTYDVDVVIVPWMADACTLNSFSEVRDAPNCPEVMCALYCENGFQKDAATGCDICSCNDSEPETPATTEATSNPAKPTCSPVMCMMYCEYGNVKDANGCPMCMCNPAPTAGTPATTDKVAGGLSPVTVSDEAVVSAATCAVQTIGKDEESTNAMVLMEVVSGTQQVVAGIKYKLRIRVGQSSSCANDGAAHSLKECPVASTDFRGEYDVTVVMQPWVSTGPCVSAEHTLVSSDGTIVSSSTSGNNKSGSSSDVVPLVVGMCGGALVILIVAAVVIARNKAMRNRYEVAATTPTPAGGYENPTYNGSSSSSVLDLELSD